MKLPGHTGCAVSVLQQESPSDPVGNTRNAESVNYRILGRKTIFLLSACPKPMADVVSHVAAAWSVRNPCSLERWDGASVRSGVPIFLLPSRGCRGSAAAAGGRDPAALPGAAPLQPGPHPNAAALLGVVVMLPLQLESLHGQEMGTAPGRAPCPSLTAELHLV